MAQPVTNGRKPPRRNHSPRKAKSHWFYTSTDVTKLYCITPNTLRRWVKDGLEPMPGSTGTFKGSTLNAFHQHRRDKARRPCGPAEFYCVRCKIVCDIVGRHVRFKRTTERGGAIAWSCPVCGRQNGTFVTPEKLGKLLGAGVNVSGCETAYNGGCFAAGIVQNPTLKAAAE